MEGEAEGGHCDNWSFLSMLVWSFVVCLFVCYLFCSFVICLVRLLFVWSFVICLVVCYLFSSFVICFVCFCFPFVCSFPSVPFKGTTSVWIEYRIIFTCSCLRLLVHVDLLCDHFCAGREHFKN